MLEERPERVVTLTQDGTSTEEVIALGGAPVVSDLVDTGYEWLDPELVAKIETQVPDDQSNPYPAETIAAAEPDLIIINDEIGDYYEQLSSIAPVLYVDRTDVPEGTPRWTKSLDATAEELDLQAAAEEATANYYSTVEGVKEANPEFEGKTVSYLVYFGADGGLSYESATGSDPANLLEEIGFAANPKAEQFVGATLDDRTNRTVSTERIGEVAADAIILSDNSKGDLETITGNELWKNLDAVKNDRVVLMTNNGVTYEVDGESHPGNLPWAFARTSLLGKAWAAERVAELLSPKFD